MTQIAEIITEYCMKQVQDEDLEELFQTDTALFFRRAWGYLLPALSLFTTPFRMQTYLFGSASDPKLVEPSYDSTLVTVSEDHEEPFTVALGEEYAGYELCGARIRAEDAYGGVGYQPLTADYDASTGNLTLPAMSAGTTLDVDFYTDGYFVNNLTNHMKLICGMLFEEVWSTRLSEDLLDRTPKIEDRSFKVPNIANKQNSDNERLRYIRTRNAGEMRALEQNMFMAEKMPGLLFP